MLRRQLPIVNNNQCQAVKAAIVMAMTTLVLTSPSVFGQESIWSSDYEMAAHEYDDKDFASAEKILLDAVKEAEQLPKTGKQLLKTLQLLRKVYIALDKQSSAEQIATRIKSLGETVGDRADTSSTESKPNKPAAATSSKPNDDSTTGKSQIGNKQEFDVERQPMKDAAHSQNGNDQQAVATSIGSTGEIQHDVVTKAKEILKLEGHSGWTKAVQISADATKALSGSTDDTVRLWDLVSGKELGKYEGHEDDVNSVCFSPAGNTALSGSTDKTLRLWDLDAGTQIRKFVGHTNIVTCVAFSPSGSKAASGSYDGTVRLWDTTTGKELLKMEGNLGSVKCLAFSPDGEKLVSGGTDKLITLWRLKDGVALRRFTGHKAEIASVAVSSDGSRVLSTSRDSTIRVWDLGSGEELKCLTGHTNWIPLANFLSVDKAISGSLDKTFRIWDLDVGKESRTYSIQHFGMWSLAFSEAGDRAITGSDDFTLRVWQMNP